MFPVTRPVRQALATLAVIALTMAPTGYVAILAWRINRPGHVRDVEIELGRQLGLQVTLHGVHYPRPGEVVYEGIVLRQDEPRGRSLAEVARADRVRVERVDRELILQLENVQVHAESPKMALDRLSTLLRISGQGAFNKVNLTAPACQIELGQAGLSFSLTDLAGEFQADPATPTCRLAYRFPDEGGGTRCETTLTRDRRADPPQTSLVFRTVEGLPLPARVLDCFFDSRDWLGDNAQVEGTLSLRKIGSQDWEAEFQGDLHDVNLSNLVGKRFPRHLLTGRAHVAFQSARWGLRPNQGMGWVAVIGELSAGQGTIGVNLLAALAREMKFRLSPRLANLDPRKTEVDFRIGPVVRDRTERRDPGCRRSGVRIRLRRRSGRWHDVALIRARGHRERARTDQDALSFVASESRRSHSLDRRVAGFTFAASARRSGGQGQAHC